MAAEFAARDGPPLSGAVSNCRPEAPGFPEFPERQFAGPFVGGFLRILHMGVDGVAESRLSQQNLRRIGEVGYWTSKSTLKFRSTETVRLAARTKDRDQPPDFPVEGEPHLCGLNIRHQVKGLQPFRQPSGKIYI